ncbi:hypothetical protein SSPO_045700 [Streptomyces antimycoticus]|uniref:Uncharacterized protein n=1 Tax=Streptomyces antimycoticus TaxID=68175 RepID=A0A499ULU4_9ACTN|nr:hypothetical protein SSPO_045700 [Streptomyces antimycoticus]
MSGAARAVRESAAGRADAAAEVAGAADTRAATAVPAAAMAAVRRIRDLRGGAQRMTTWGAPVPNEDRTE